MDRNAFSRAAGAGTPAQLLLVLSGHFIPFVADNLFAVGGVVIALVAGLLYVREDNGPNWFKGAFVSGAACALVGLAVAAALHDVPWLMLLIGGLAAGVAGLAGGTLERMLASRRG